MKPFHLPVRADSSATQSRRADGHAALAPRGVRRAAVAGSAAVTEPDSAPETAPDSATEAEAAPPAEATSEEGAAAAAFAAIQQATLILQSLNLSRMGENDLLETARDLESTVRRLYGAQVRIAAELAERNLAERSGARSSQQLLTLALRITAGDARSRLAAAAVGMPQTSLTGAIIEPIFPEMLQAIDDGIISDRHAAVITSGIDALPSEVDADTRTMCKNLLLSEARHSDPNRLRRVAEHIRNICDPDGKLTDKPAFDRAELHFGATRSDGLTSYRGLADTLTMAQLRAAIDDLSRPQPIDENTPDPRSAPVRRAQAFHEVLRRYLATAGVRVRAGAGAAGAGATVAATATATTVCAGIGPGPSNGGARPQIGITINVEDLLGTDHGTGAGQFDDGHPVGRATAQMLACDSDLIRLLAGADSAILDQGRPKRLFTRAQRRALIARDKGCAFPGCDIPATWCEAHHITYWSAGGATDLGNGVMLCRRHHTMIHQEHWRIATDIDVPASTLTNLTTVLPATVPASGSTVLAAAVSAAIQAHPATVATAATREAGLGLIASTTLGNASRPDAAAPKRPARGRPWFIPPRWIDPQQQPRRNNHFFLPQLKSIVMRQ